MDDSKEPWRLAIFLATIFVGVVFLLFLFVVPWPKTWAEWGGGTKAPAEVVSLILTPLGVLVALVGLGWNISNSNRTLRHSVNVDVISRFQKASEMLSDPSAPKSIAGANLIKSIAASDPDQYLTASVDMLKVFAAECDLDIKLPRESGDPDPPPLRVSDPRAMYALEAISELRPHGGWSPTITVDGQIPIGRIYIGQRRCYELVLPSMTASRWLIDRTTFDHCDFSHSYIGFMLGTDVKFVECNLRGAQLKIWDQDRSLIGVGVGTGRLRFEGGNTEGLTITGVPFARWQTTSFFMEPRTSWRDGNTF